MVVFDEAHHLTAREGSDGINRAERYRVGEAVAGSTDALLLLTGTPHKGEPYQFYHLLRLLDSYRFRGPDDVRPGKLEDLMIRRKKSDDSIIDADGTPMFPPREIQTLGVSLTPEERRLYDDDVLLDALERGVELTVVTRYLGDFSSHNHSVIQDFVRQARERGVARGLSTVAYRVWADDMPAHDWNQEEANPAFTLHAKLMVFDRTSAYVGSANVTDYGFGRYLELGVLLGGLR